MRLGSFVRVIPSEAEGSRTSYLKGFATGSLDFARDDEFNNAHFDACSAVRSKISSSAGSPGGKGVVEFSGVVITLTPRSPILFRLKPANGEIDSAICRNTSSIEPRPLLPVSS